MKKKTKKTKKTKKERRKSRTRRTPYEWKKFRKITKVGGYSYSVTIPMDVMRKFKWREKQRVELIVDEKRKTVIIKDYVP